MGNYLGLKFGDGVSEFKRWTNRFKTPFHKDDIVRKHYKLRGENLYMEISVRESFLSGKPLLHFSFYQHSGDDFAIVSDINELDAITKKFASRIRYFIDEYCVMQFEIDKRTRKLIYS